jgi:hypothetical protein
MTIGGERNGSEMPGKSTSTLTLLSNSQVETALFNRNMGIKSTLFKF